MYNIVDRVLILTHAQFDNVAPIMQALPVPARQLLFCACAVKEEEKGEGKPYPEMHHAADTDNMV